MNPNYHRPPLRVALFGLGRAMFEEHFQIYRAHRALFEVVAACDLIKERRDLVAKDFPGCKMFRQFADMLDERDIDLVDIATCSKDHVEHALASLAKGFWTLLESPMALDYDAAQVLRGASVKARNRLLVLQRGMFAADFQLAQRMMSEPRLGEIHQIRIRREDYVRRDDWQAVKRLGGGAAYYAMPDLVMQAMKLLPVPPVQMWSELKRVASLGDAEDYAHVVLKTRDQLSVDLEFNGGAVPGGRSPSFVIAGSRGTFTVEPGQPRGLLRVIDPAFEFPRRRASVRTPSFESMHEKFEVVEIPVALPKDTLYGATAFWRHVYDTVRTGAAFPLSLNQSIEAVRFAHLMKKSSPYGA